VIDQSTLIFNLFVTTLQLLILVYGDSRLFHWLFLSFCSEFSSNKPTVCPIIFKKCVHCLRLDGRECWIRSVAWRLHDDVMAHLVKSKAWNFVIESFIFTAVSMKSRLAAKYAFTLFHTFVTVFWRIICLQHYEGTPKVWRVVHCCIFRITGALLLEFWPVYVC